MRTTTRALLAGLALVAVLGGIGPSTPTMAAPGACTTSWATAADGAWTDPARWSTGVVPTATDHVCITVAGAYTVTVDDSVARTVASLTVGTSTGLPDAQVLRIGSPTASTSMLATDGIVVEASGEIELQRAVDTSVTLGVGPTAGIAVVGRLEAGSPPGGTGATTIAGDVTSTGFVGGDDGPITIDGDVTTDGDLTTTGALTVTGTFWARAGTVIGEGSLTTPTAVRIGDASAWMGDGIVATTGASVSFDGDGHATVHARGAVDLLTGLAPDQRLAIEGRSGVAAVVRFSGALVNRGTISIDPQNGAGAQLVGTDPGDHLVNEGQIDRDAGGDGGAKALVSVPVLNTGRIATSDGTLVFGEELRSTGEVDLARGTLDADEDLVLTPTSLLVQSVIGGSLADAGRIVVDGTATIAGDLRVVTSYAAQPSVGSTVMLMIAPDATGTFDDVRFVEASYDVLYETNVVRLRRRAPESATHRLVRAAFQDFLGRQPTGEELADRATAIDGGSLTRAGLVRQLSQSTDYVTALVQRFYTDTLGRPGDPDGVSFWVEQLRSGRRTVAEVAGSFYASEEYYSRVGGIPGAWIDDLYQVFFERLPATGDRDYWVARIAARGRTRVATELFQSLESRRQRVDRLYQDLLGRDSDAAGRDFWAARITTQGDLALAVNLASSAEYLDRAQLRYP
jgi:hypothetical protein